ncbi:MAG TPA: UDP-N-acetylmuramoyl-tripeptide--D-alanyl-D-alanine ligase [Fimbriimonadaceae bacterium]|nr:UDP-N-acetylmuramoyl-tripeptide--D-alanyl-D-alanine ligase [Fimbriimonadaceae bacterium]
MKPIALHEFALRCAGIAVQIPEGAFLTGFGWDSRTVQSGQLFLAIEGERADGHQFVPEALARGAIATIAERTVPGPHILVENLESALAHFASGIRESFAGPVIGITGSNGKTTTKEFVAAACSPLGSVKKSGGNLNTEYTSPLLWAEVESDTAVVVAEMAMRGLGQIRHLASFARPTIGLVTMIGTAHIEKVGSREKIAEAKGELLEALPTDGLAIFWQEDDFQGTLRAIPRCPIRTFGFSPDAECQILGYRAVAWNRSVVRARLDGIVFEATLHALGRHQALNAAAAVLAAHSVGVAVEEAARCLPNADLPPMRMEARPLRGAMLLVDSYNASPDSTVAAIKALAELPAEGRKLAVLGEMRELGEFSETGHRLVGRAVAESPIDHVLLFGPMTSYIQSEAVRAGFPEGRIASATSLDEVRSFLEQLEPGDVALFKGSRALELEKAVEAVAL